MIRLRAMPELPSETVTFLFTDIEGSTRRLHEHGEGYVELVSAPWLRATAPRITRR